MSTIEKTFKKIAPSLPSLEDWQKLEEQNDHATVSMEPVVDIIVPVYRGLEETLRCLYSVNSILQATPFRLIVINDKSPQAELVEWLEIIERMGFIELYNNQSNLGFVGSVNFGMKLHDDRDVVLLNSDTEVYGDWLDRLVQVSNLKTKIGTVTPLSNNAEICSYPHFIQDNDHELEIDGAGIDAFASILNKGSFVEAPTGVGFCMFIKRACINDVGYFNEEEFGRGYGEENDFCQRILRCGYLNVIAPNIYVRHYGSTSFGADKTKLIRSAIAKLAELHPNYALDVERFIAIDPLKKFRSRIDIARIKNLSSKYLITIISHNRGGGTERHVSELSRRIEDEEGFVLRFRPNHHDETFFEIDDDRFPNIGPFCLHADNQLFVHFLMEAEVDLLHLHHLVDLDLISADYFRITAKLANIPYDFTVHDYFSACPRINLIDQYGTYCSEPDISVCERCVKADDFIDIMNGRSVWEWRDRFGRMLRHARRVWVPNLDVANRMQRYFPTAKFDLRPHFDSSGSGQFQKNSTVSCNVERRDSRKKIAVLGVIGHHKGSSLLAEVARETLSLGLESEFVVIGYTDKDEELRSIGNVTITGPYNDKDVVMLLKEQNPDFVWMSSIWPETYSYTLSHVLDGGFTPVAFNFGAVAERMNSLGVGKLLPLELMLRPENLANELNKIDSSEPMSVMRTVTNYGSIRRDYYHL